MKEDGFNGAYSNAVKGIAIILMLVHHNWYEPEMYRGGTVVLFSPFTEYIVVHVGQWSKICVAFFVFITAFGLSRKLENTHRSINTVKNYFMWCWTRLFKLLANYWFVFVLALIYDVVMEKGRFIEAYGDCWTTAFPIDILGLASLLHSPTYNATWWYMSLAIILVFTIPVIYKLYERYGIGVLIATLIVSYFAGKYLYSPLSRYIPIMVLGIFVADKYLLELWKEKIQRWNIYQKLLGFTLEIIVMAAVVVVFFKFNRFNSVALCDGIGILFIIMNVFMLDIKGRFNTCLCFLGSHSMNIFYMHTFIYYYWYHEFIYSVQYAVLITPWLLIVSLFISMIIEYIKSVVRFEKIFSLVGR